LVGASIRLPGVRLLPSTLLLLALTVPAHAAVVCGAAALCAAGVDPCDLSGTIDVGEGCALDFGTRSVIVRGTMRAERSGGRFALKAGALTLHGASLQARGTTADFGGVIDVTLTGAFRMTGSGPRVNVDGQAGGGTFYLSAGSIDVAAGNPAMSAIGTTGEAAGGEITLVSSGAVRIAGAFDVSGGLLEDGGAIDVTGASVLVEKPLDASAGGADGGSVSLWAEVGDVVMTSAATILVESGVTDDWGGSGGTVSVYAAGDATLDTITGRGASPDGNGGSVEIDVPNGDVQLLGPFSLQGNGLDSGGGDVTISVGGELMAADVIDVRGGADGFGGDVFLDVGRRLTVPAGAEMRASGGYRGGRITTAPSPATVELDGALQARGSRGGTIDLGSHCSMAVGGILEASGTAGGFGGTIKLAAAQMTLESSAKLLSLECLAAPNCGENQLVTKTPPVIAAGAVVLPAAVVALEPGMTACCGNGHLDGGEACDDGNLDHCDGCDAACAVEPTPVCPPSGSECTAVACVPSRGCTTTPRTGLPCASDDDACTTDVCQAGTCAHPQASCSDEIACTIETCDPLTGCASTPVDAACDDGNPCTVEHCDPVAGCVAEPLPDQSPCSDQNVCTTGDVCMAGHCVTPGPSLGCDDGNPCTDDGCDGLTGCRHLENPARCPCSVGGTPRPSGTACVDGNGCTVGETCDGAGACTDARPRDCGDGDACTTDVCASGICLHFDDACPAGCAGKPDGTACSDGRPCTTGACQAGACVATPVSCGDGAACAGPEVCVDAPWPFGCLASTAPDGSACEDGDACTAGDACERGVCIPGDGPACGACETCDADEGCVAAPRVACVASASPEKTLLMVKDRALDAGDQLIWKWVRGGATSLDAFGDPTTSDGQALCIFDGNGDLFLGLDAPAGDSCAGAPCWKPLGSIGFKYSDKEATPSGITTLFEKAGPAGKSRIMVKGRGALLDMPPLPPALPLTVQLQTGTGACFEARYEAGGVTRSTPSDLKVSGR